MSDNALETIVSMIGKIRADKTLHFCSQTEERLIAVQAYAQALSKLSGGTENYGIRTYERQV